MLAPAAIQKSPGYWAGVMRRFRRDPVAMIALAVVLALILMAVFAPFVAPADPYRASMLRRLRPIGTEGFPLGTDELGRDMLSRLIYGGRLSLLMGVTPVFIAFFIGSAIGITAVWRMAPCAQTAISVVPPPMSIRQTPRSFSSSESTA